MTHYNGMVLMTEEEFEKLQKKEVKLTRAEFVKLWEAEEIKEFNGVFENDCFEPMTVHWNGFCCYVGTGAQVSNYIIPTIKDVDDELDEEDDKEWREEK